VVLILDSGAVSRLAERSRQAFGLITALREQNLWPPLVPSVVLVECLQGHTARDVLTNAFLKTCNIVEEIPESTARRAALLRRLAHRGSAVDALIVALAEPDGTILTSDQQDITALAQFAQHVNVERV
jgi:predicted nucleic acid-binding protein